MSADEHSTTAVVAAFAANLGIAIMKFVGFAVTGSRAMLAEAVHSVADTGNEGLLLIGGHKSKRMADVDHPFGYGRERYFWAFVVSVLLFSLGGLFSIYDGIEKLLNPHELESVGWAVGILLGGLWILLAIPIASVIATLVDVLLRGVDPAEVETPTLLFAAKDSEG